MKEYTHKEKPVATIPMVGRYDLTGVKDYFITVEKDGAIYMSKKIGHTGHPRPKRVVYNIMKDGRVLEITLPTPPQVKKIFRDFAKRMKAKRGQ